MNEPEPRPEPRANTPAEGGRDLFLSVISAALFLYVGFVLAPAGISGNVLYDGSCSVLTWGARAIGIGILITAAMALLHVTGTALFDFVLAALATVLCAAVGLVWLANNDMEGVLLLLFAALNGSATRGAWLRWSHADAP